MAKFQNMIGRMFPSGIPTPKVSFDGVLVKVVYVGFIPGIVLEDLQSKDRSFIRRAMDQQENIRKVIGMGRTSGLDKALARIKGKSCGLLPVGYSASGIVLAAGEGVKDIRPGDRVAITGQDESDYAEFLDVPRDQVVTLPPELSFADAATATVGGLAMHAVRRAEPRLGEFCLIFGGGMVGQIAVRLAVAAGARVLAVEHEKNMLDLALAGGAEAAFDFDADEALRSVMQYTDGKGVDSTIFCLSTDKTKDLAGAVSMTRAEGRVVLLGVPDRELFRGSLARKELKILIANTAGPCSVEAACRQSGAADSSYNYIRWTQRRNLAEYLRLLAVGKISIKELVHGRYSAADPERIVNEFALINRHLLFLLDYGEKLPENLDDFIKATARVSINAPPKKKVLQDSIKVGIIGTGGFTVANHLPTLAKIKDFELVGVCNYNAAKAVDVAKKFGAAYATADPQEILQDPSIDLTIICARNNEHGTLALQSLQQGKHTFVEKPLCINLSELEAIEAFYRQEEPLEKPLLMVGLNRRFSKYIKEIRRAVEGRINPLIMHYRMNAGYIPPDHWLHRAEGGGRMVAEACQVLDVFSCLVGTKAVNIGAAAMRPLTGSFLSADNRSIIIEYEDGSLASIDYFAVGSKDLSKELLEVHFDGCSIIMEDYKSLKSYGVFLENLHSAQPDKGWKEELEAIAACLRGDAGWPIPLWSMFECSRLSFMLS